MIKKILVIFLFVPSVVFAMDTTLFDEMMTNIHSEKFEPVENFLDENQSKFKQDPEYFVILLNYSFKKGYKEQIVIAKGQAPKGTFELQDKNTGKPVGFIGSVPTDPTGLIIEGISKTQKALPNFSDRLDIHFGIIHIASKIERWDILCDQSIQILTLSKTNGNKWTWGPVNSMKGNPKSFMLENLQAKVHQLFYAENEKADKALIKISEAMVKEYPDVVYGYTNLGTLFSIKNQYDLAEKYLNKALAIAPEDEIVKNNLKRLKEMR